MSLPAAWVDALFAKLAVRYGAAFMRQWDGIDPAAIKADWSDVLAGFQAHPAAFRAALENLPDDKPPNAMAFRALCRTALRDDRQTAPPALPAPKADPTRVATLLAGLRRSGEHDPRQWARDLRAREEAQRIDAPSVHGRLTKFQRDAWREALASEMAAQAAAQVSA